MSRHRVKLNWRPRPADSDHERDRGDSLGHRDRSPEKRRGGHAPLPHFLDSSARCPAVPQSRSPTDPNKNLVNPAVLPTGLRDPIAVELRSVDDRTSDLHEVLRIAGECTDFRR